MGVKGSKAAKKLAARVKNTPPNVPGKNHHHYITPGSQNWRKN